MDVVLTASHGFSGLPPEFTEIWLTLDEVIDADQDGVVDAGVELLMGTPQTHPLFGTGGQNNTYDIAVFLLDEPVTGIEPATIAALGTLESATARQQTYTAVGYGRSASFADRVASRERRPAPAVGDESMATTFSMNLATGNGGTCYGDSGEPHFLGSVVVSITVTGDSMCKATDKTYRIDTPWAQDFLSDYVTLG